MKTEEIKLTIEKLLGEVEEEEIGINLLRTYAESREELAFFPEFNQKKVKQILTRLSEDSLRHKKLLYELAEELTKEMGQRG